MSDRLTYSDITDYVKGIEDAKSPAQKRREKQARCHHDFPARGAKPRCRICNLAVPRAVADAYDLGKEHAWAEAQRELG